MRFGRVYTDKQFLQIFQSCPHWLPPLLNERYASVAFAVDSIVLKSVETELRADIVFTPQDDTDPRVPIIVVEMQMQPCPTVFNRTLSEVLRVERLNPTRPVVGIVIFGNSKLDIHNSP